jgi:ribonuclease BN (tRNA processing enzyme)
MSANIRIVGCRAGSPLFQQPASGTIVSTDKGTVLIDCGPGVLVNLSDTEVDRLEAVILTHRHADHTMDLMALAYRLLFPYAKKRIPLYGPPSIGPFIEEYDALYGIPSLPTLHHPIVQAFEFIAVTPGEGFSIDGFGQFGTCVMHHPIETMAIKSLDYRFAITADGSYTPTLQSFCEGCSILIAEATYPDGEGRNIEEHGHMTAQQCAQLAERAKVKHLVVSHLSDPNDSEVTMKTVKANFNGEALLGKPGLQLIC